MIFFVVCLAESNRSPFDFAEGESELVSGYNVEYSGPKFVTLFLAEYLSILFLSFLCGCLCSDGCWFFSILGSLFFAFSFI
jgi:NADH-ubiquinone oxidoreductase chain 1